MYIHWFCLRRRCIATSSVDDVDECELGWDNFMRPRHCEGRTYLWTPPSVRRQCGHIRAKENQNQMTNFHPCLRCPKNVRTPVDEASVQGGGHRDCTSWCRTCLCGVVTCMNRSFSPLLFLFSETSHGNFAEPPKMYHMGSKLGRSMFKGDDVDPRDFWCANFGFNVTGLELLCQRMCCRSCYTLDIGPNFFNADE